jgi:hypothetical protein
LSWAPAYEQTNVKIRSLEDYKEQRNKEKEEHDKAILESLNAKLKEIEDIEKEYKL